MDKKDLNLVTFQLFSNMCINFIISNILETINTLPIVFDFENPKVLKYIHVFQKLQAYGFLLLALIEIICIKYWFKFRLKRMISMNDSFIVFSLTLINIQMSSLLALSKIILGDADRMEFISLQEQVIKKPRLQFKQ